MVRCRPLKVGGRQQRRAVRLRGDVDRSIMCPDDLGVLAARIRPGVASRPAAKQRPAVRLGRARQREGRQLRGHRGVHRLDDRRRWRPVASAPTWCAASSSGTCRRNSSRSTSSKGSRRDGLDPAPPTALAEVVAELDPDVIYLHNVFDPAVVSAIAAIGGSGDADVVRARPLPDVSQRAALASRHRQLPAASRPRLPGRHRRRALRPAPPRPASRRGRRRATHRAEPIARGSRRDRRRQRLHAGAPPRRRNRSSTHASTCCLDRSATSATCDPVTGPDPMIRRSSPTPGGSPPRRASPSSSRRSAPPDRDAPSSSASPASSRTTTTGRTANSCRPRRWRANPGLTITYLGHLDYDATDELFRQSDIVTVPSQWPEPLGAVALEAMSAGAAVIASSVGGLNDTSIHDHNGLHAEPGDVDSWAERPHHAAPAPRPRPPARTPSAPGRRQHRHRRPPRRS